MSNRDTVIGDTVGGDAVTVRRVTEADGPAAQAIRLEMLTDAPDAYLETAAHHAALPAAEQSARLIRAATSTRVAQFVAVHGDRFVASATGLAAPDDPREVILVAVYVTPRHRGTGVLGAVVEAVADWAREQGRSLLRLEVITGNDRAQRAYEKIGFVHTGELLPHPTKPGETEFRLRRAV